MRCLAVLSLLLISSSVSTFQESSIFPPNDLWMEDSLYAKGGISVDVFKEIIAVGKESYQKKEAVKRNERVVVNALWTDSTVNANVRRTAKYGGSVIINMYGGLARRGEITPAGFATVLCHEFGHAYGGEPYVYEPAELSAEGMADYYSTLECARRIAEKVPALMEPKDEYEPFIEEKCEQQDVACKNILDGAKGLATLLSSLMKEETPPSFETPDPFVTDETILSYPATSQCRLDSYVAGVFVYDKPACWFKD